MTERKIVEHYGGMTWDDEDIPLEKFIAELAAELKSVPPECRASAVLHINGHEYYSSLCVRYRGPETDAQLAGRLRWEAQHAAEREDRDRREYERLREKYR